MVARDLWIKGAFGFQSKKLIAFLFDKSKLFKSFAHKSTFETLRNGAKTLDLQLLIVLRFHFSIDFPVENKMKHIFVSSSVSP